MGVAIIAALSTAGCAKKDPSVTRIEGSEPQRLAFGTPDKVQQVFVNKMKLCWFAGPRPLLAGLRFDENPPNTDGGSEGGNRIVIYGTQSGTGFIVQFYAFNDNTLISTRNAGLPVPLAAQMKRDVETWILERNDCMTPDGSSKDAATAAVAADPVPRSRWSSW